MTVPAHLWRFPTAEAIAALARRFGLPNTREMQDWPWEVADPSRIPEFLAAYRASDMTDDERFVLMEMLIQSFEESSRDLESDPDWVELLRLLEEHAAVHANTIWYWADRALDAPLEDHFRVARFLGPVLDRNRGRFSFASEAPEDNVVGGQADRTARSPRDTPTPSPSAYSYSAGDVFVAIDDWKGGSGESRAISYGARVLFADDASSFLRLLVRAGAFDWHGSADRAVASFMFESPQFEEILNYLEVGPTRYYGMLQSVEDFTSVAVEASARRVLDEYPQLAPIVPNNPYGRALFWFLDRLLHELSSEFPSRPIRVFVDALDWDRRDKSSNLPVPYAFSSQHDACVHIVRKVAIPNALEAAALLGLVDSELWAFGRIQTLPFPDGSTLRERLLRWQADRHDDPLFTEDELAQMLARHRDHWQIQEYWQRSTPWMLAGRVKVITESGVRAPAPQRGAT